VATDRVAHRFLWIKVPFSIRPRCSHCLSGPQTRKVLREGDWVMSKHATGINDYYMLPHTARVGLLTDNGLLFDTNVLLMSS